MVEEGASVLITGATGFTGSVLVRRLCESGCNVRAIARASSDKSHLKDLPIEWMNGEVFDADTIKKAVKGVDYIFHVAAAYRSAAITDEIYYKVHVESTQKLAKAAIELAPNLKRFVHFSTIGVHGHIEEPPANEDAPFSPGDIYQETKLEAENWITNFSRKTQLPLTVIRPAAIYGPSDDRLLKLFKMAKLPIIPIIGRTQGMYHLIHVEDLVSFVLVAASSQQTLGNVYICGNAKPTSIQKIIQVVATELGKTARYVRLPASPIFFAARVCESACKLIGVEPPIYPRRVAFFTKDRAFDTSKMHSVEGYKQGLSNAEGIIATLRAYQKLGLM